jgi:phenylpyruvate tautomerase PptA (4-oxalocrotonate tautomerase family)
MPMAHIHFMYDLVEGDLQEAKRNLAADVTASIARHVVHQHQGSPEDLVTVMFHDIGADDWATGGTLFRDRTG